MSPSISELKTAKNIDGLIDALDREAWNARNQASDAIRDVSDASTVDLLVSILKEGRRKRLIRAGVAMTLGKIGDIRAVESLIAALKDSDWNVQNAAAEALGQIGDNRAVEPLIALLKTGEHMISTTGALGMFNDVRAVEALKALKDQEVEALKVLKAQESHAKSRTRFNKIIDSLQELKPTTFPYGCPECARFAVSVKGKPPFSYLCPKCHLHWSITKGERPGEYKWDAYEERISGFHNYTVRDCLKCGQKLSFYSGGVSGNFNGRSVSFCIPCGNLHTERDYDYDPDR
jgi:hypothetical protein